MPGLIDQLQGDALDDRTSVANLLRKVKVAAAKLGLDSVENWVLLEMNGYTENVPDYRIVQGSPMAFNPYRGWIPLVGDTADRLSRRAVGQSIGSLEALISHTDRKGGSLEMPFPSSVCAMIDRNTEVPMHRYSLHIDRTQMISIVDNVRNLVLDWAVELEKSGVRGDGLSFSDRDRESAQKVSNTISIGSIGTLTGNLGSGNTTGDITVGAIDNRAVSALADQIERYLPALQADGVPSDHLREPLQTLRAELDAPQPDTGRVRSALSDLRNALSGAGGSLLASGIIEGISKILG